MGESEFNDLVDEIFDNLEDQIDELPADIDVDAAGSVMTVIFPNASQVILSRQIATLEIWVAARSGGFHLARSGDDWVCSTTQESLAQLLSRVFTEQLGESVSLNC